MAKILFDAGHPGDVHLFHYVARALVGQGHEVLFTALDREIIVQLLAKYDLPYRVTYVRRKGKLALLREVALRSLVTYRIARSFGADLLASFGSPVVAFPAWLLRKPYLALTDTEHATEQHATFKPFATAIATPTTFTGDLGPNQVWYPGYHELAYLHPDVFTPDPAYLEPLGLQPGDPFFIVRFVAWDATHDVGQHGFTLAQKRSLLRELARHGRVLLSVEDAVDDEFAGDVMHFPPEIVHHLLAYATMYVGEGATMASEAAVLGVPSVFVNTLTMGYTDELRHKYGLLSQHSDGAGALADVRDLLAMPDLKAEWAQRRAVMLADKINVTPWLVDLCNDLIAGGR